MVCQESPDGASASKSHLEDRWFGYAVCKECKKRKIGAEKSGGEQLMSCFGQGQAPGGAWWHIGLNGLFFGG